MAIKSKSAGCSTFEPPKLDHATTSKMEDNRSPEEYDFLATTGC